MKAISGPQAERDRHGDIGHPLDYGPYIAHDLLHRTASKKSYVLYNFSKIALGIWQLCMVSIQTNGR